MPRACPSLRTVASLLGAFALCCTGHSSPAQSPAKAHTRGPAPLLDRQQLASRYFGNDAPWYRERIPFLDIDDPLLQRIYYYRWQVYRSHLRQIGATGTDETEFLPDVPWARHPYTDLNDSSSFHILEGRWLRDPAPVTSLVDHLYTGAGNDRHFSESIAAATLGWVEVTGNPQPALRHLDTMRHIYNLWDDHFDARRNLYWIEPLLDATEYTISSIDASGAGFTDHPAADPSHNGFTGGYAFRPSINAYQFGNARAIAQLATLAGEPAVSAVYTTRAAALRHAVLTELWNPRLQHFTDIYQRSTPTVEAGTFIRGRELVGFVPWAFDLVPTAPSTSAGAGEPDYTAAWAHALAPAELAGPKALRTVEPTYPRYLAQYRYDAATGLRECQWNGPAWPFQIAQTLTGMANLLQDPQQHALTPDDFVHELRRYAQLHLLASGTADLEEDYNPDTGAPIVGLPRSHHYNHSTFNDLLLSGLLGIRPRLDDVLELHPLLPAPHGTEPPIRYFALDHLRYHGRDLTVLYDEDGSRYGRGAGVSVFNGSTRLYGPRPLRQASATGPIPENIPDDIQIPLNRAPRQPAPPAASPAAPRADLAVNVWERAPSPDETSLPIATASSSLPARSPYQAIDGRLWFFPEVPNGWSPAVADPATPAAAAATPDWIALDLRTPQRAGSVELAFFSDGASLQAPLSVRLEVLQNGVWQRIPGQHMDEATPVANGITHLRFPPTRLQQLRVVLQRKPGTQLRLVECELYAPAPSR